MENIFSANDEMLATSVPLYKLAIDPAVAPDKLYTPNLDTISTLLADFFGDRSKGEYLRYINDARRSGKRYLVLNSKLLSFLDKKKD